MADTAPKNDGSAIPAIIGWGALALFTIGFAYVVIGQLKDTEQWSGKTKDAIDMVRAFKPDGQPETLDDLLRGYSLKAKEKGGYVGEFSWNSTQKDGPEYEVSLLWKEGNNHRTALWRVDLDQKAVRPQGDAASLPQRARDGTFGG